MSKIDRKGLELVMLEMNELSVKNPQTRAEQTRYAFLMSAASTLRAGGVTLAQIDKEQHNERMREHGLPEMAESRDGEYLTEKQEKRATTFRSFLNAPERRDMIEGVMTPHIAGGNYTSLGFFVPTDFFPKVFAAMKAHDCLFDEDIVTFIKSTNGRPMPIPLYGDTENVASIVAEAATQTSTDIFQTDHAVIGAWGYKTPRFVVSMEAFQDLEGSITVESLFRKFSADRLARGIGQHLVNGNGVGQPFGLIPSLIAAGVVPITAQGSSGNDGSGATAANSLGSVDFANAFSELDAAYIGSPKCRWLMNIKTFATVLNLSDKDGRPIKLIKYENGSPTIYGIKIGICPSMDSIGPSKSPVVLADLSYWATRVVTDDNAGIAIYHEAPGLVENGNVGLRTFVRADGRLLWSDVNSPAPAVIIQNHS
jgi:HK97 family phage major capsid protein